MAVLVKRVGQHLSISRRPAIGAETPG
jgi:hypothetical protein